MTEQKLICEFYGFPIYEGELCRYCRKPLKVGDAIDAYKPWMHENQVWHTACSPSRQKPVDDAVRLPRPDEIVDHG